MFDQETTIPTGQICPSCGAECSRDEADIGVGTIYGPWGCPCGWSEDPRYDVRGGARTERGHRIDQWGGLTPQPAPAETSAEGERRQMACPMTHLPEMPCGACGKPVETGECRA